MKELLFRNKKSTKLWLLACSLIIIILIGGLLFFVNRQTPTSQATQTLSGLFTVTQQDETALHEALASDSSTAVTQYVNTRYPDLFTAEGYESGLNNRIFSKAISAATQANDNFAVSSVALSRRKSDSDIWYFDYTVTAKAQGDSGAVLQARGGIEMVQDSGDWKAKSVGIDKIAVA